MKNKKPTQSPEDKFGNALSALIAKHLYESAFPQFRGKLTLVEIENETAEVLAGYNQKINGSEEDDELPSTLLADRVDTLERKIIALESKLATKKGRK